MQYDQGPAALESKFQFSTTERETPFTWIDGKRIYCKVLDLTTTNAQTSHAIISDSELDEFVACFLTVHCTTDGNVVTIGNYYLSGNDSQASFLNKQNGIWYYIHRSGTMFAFGKERVIVLYTKKDTSNS